MDYCKCLKCEKKFFYEYDMEEIKKKGCLSCQSKNLEWKETVDDFEIEFITNECPKCHLMRVIDISNWEKIKGRLIKMGLKTKQEAIKEINKKEEKVCYCDNLEDNNTERERERETKKLKNYGERLPS